MRRWAWMLVLFAVPALHAQVTNPGIVLVGSAPSGACARNLPDEQVINVGTLYSCQNGTWAQIGSGGGGGATLGANTFTGTQSAPGFAGTAGTQTVINETQGTAAAAPPANTIQRGAPLSVPSSYDMYDPSAPPSDPQGGIELVPQGGGTAAFVLPPTEALIARQTLATGTTSVTFSGIPQNYKTLKLVIASGNTSNAAAWAQLNFNGDVTAGHYFLAFSNVSFTPTASTGGGFTNPGIWVPVNASTTYIHGYSLSAGINTYSIGVVGGALEGLATAAGVWTPATPATSMVITTSTGNSFTTGSIFTLYGVY